MKGGSLFSIGQLCVDDCIAIFTKYNVQIIKHSQILINGCRSSNGLWAIHLNKEAIPISPSPCVVEVELTPEQKHIANGIIKFDTAKNELANYYAVTLFNSTKSILLRAICNNHFTSCPELTTKLVSKYLLKRLARVQGHIE